MFMNIMMIVMVMVVMVMVVMVMVVMMMSVQWLSRCCRFGGRRGVVCLVVVVAGARPDPCSIAGVCVGPYIVLLGYCRPR